MRRPSVFCSPIGPEKTTALPHYHYDYHMYFSRCMCALGRGVKMICADGWGTLSPCSGVRSTVAVERAARLRMAALVRRPSIPYADKKVARAPSALPLVFMPTTVVEGRGGELDFCAAHPLTTDSATVIIFDPSLSGRFQVDDVLCRHSFRRSAPR